MIIVNLFGGPGAGKSTTAAGVFHHLKLKGANVELVTEYAKDLTWEERHQALSNQPLVLGKQFHRIWRTKDKVDIVITDSPLLLSIIYNENRLKSIPALVIELHELFDSINYILKRPLRYTEVGRNQTLKEASDIDAQIRIMLKENYIPFRDVQGDNDGIDRIVKDVLTKC